MKIKVTRVKLIAAIEEKIAEYKKAQDENVAKRAKEAKANEAQYQAAWEAYEEKLTAYVKALKAEKDFTKKTSIPQPHAPQGYYYNTPKVDHTRYIEVCQEQIKRLKLSDEETLSLTDRDDYFRYL